MFVFCGLVAGGMLYLGSILGPKKPNPTKDKPFECGNQPFDLPGKPFSVKFYIVGMLFILFDIELVFLFPWAVVFRKFLAAGAGKFMLGEMLAFLVILIAGYVYLWKRGALEWE
ncbi:MAG: NADH-quinone oxidoreductase subunit A [Armatimonadetes bacterium]|nr:NADH-quinone oxidoreductase subunit A [Armatimonadota bacterium]